MKDNNIPAFRSSSPWEPSEYVVAAEYVAEIRLSHTQLNAIFQLLLDQSLRSSEWQEWESIVTGERTSIQELMTIFSSHLTRGIHRKK